MVWGTTVIRACCEDTDLRAMGGSRRKWKRKKPIVKCNGMDASKAKRPNDKELPHRRPTHFPGPEESREMSVGDQSEGCEAHSFSSSVRILPGSHPSIPPSADLALGMQGPAPAPV
jgi:hypothetical protein